MAENFQFECPDNANDSDEECREVFDFRGEKMSAKNREDKEEESPPPKISFAPHRRGLNETGKNLLGEVEDETGAELILVPPIHSGLDISSFKGGESCKRSSNSTITAFQTIESESNPVKKSHESIARLSRIDAAKQDAKNLRSATLGRVGRMFKIRPPTPASRGKTLEEGSDGPAEQSATATATEEQQRRKEKTHSLGRMLRLVDKDGAPRKLFSHPRTGSLTRLRKLESTVGNMTGNSDEPRSLFTRMLSQFRGKNSGAAGNAEPNLHAATEPAIALPKPSLGTRLMKSLSARGTSGAAAAEPAVESTA